MNKPWDDEPDNYLKEVCCEDCGTKLNEEFEPCKKCFSKAKHLVKYILKDE